MRPKESSAPTDISTLSGTREASVRFAGPSVDRNFGLYFIGCAAALDLCDGG